MLEIEGVYWYLVVAGALTTTLISLLLAYPLILHARNVAHTEAFILLSFAFFCITAVAIHDHLLGLTLTANTIRFIGASFAFLGTYYFARDFIVVSQDEGFGNEGGGFDSGRDD